MHSRRRSYRSLKSEYMAPRIWDVLFAENISLHWRVSTRLYKVDNGYSQWMIVGYKSLMRDNVARMRAIREASTPRLP